MCRAVVWRAQRIVIKGGLGAVERLNTVARVSWRRKQGRWVREVRERASDVYERQNRAAGDVMF